jgi:hypothetical protein
VSGRGKDNACLGAGICEEADFIARAFALYGMLAYRATVFKDPPGVGLGCEIPQPEGRFWLKDLRPLLMDSHLNSRLVTNDGS